MVMQLQSSSATAAVADTTADGSKKSASMDSSSSSNNSNSLKLIRENIMKDLITANRTINTQDEFFGFIREKITKAKLRKQVWISFFNKFSIVKTDIDDITILFDQVRLCYTHDVSIMDDDVVNETKFTAKVLEIIENFKNKSERLAEAIAEKIEAEKRALAAESKALAAESKLLAAESKLVSLTKQNLQMSQEILSLRAAKPTVSVEQLPQVALPAEAMPAPVVHTDEPEAKRARIEPRPTNS
jgi:hypothetical protein